LGDNLKNYNKKAGLLQNLKSMNTLD